MSLCGCNDNGHQEFYREETRTARKKYHCEEEDCREAICIGTRYIYIAGKSFDDYKMWYFRMCIECNEAWRRLRDIVDNADGEVCLCLGSLHEAIEEAFSNGYMDDMKEDEDVKWLMQHGYIVQDAFADDKGDSEASEDRSEGYIDRTDERQGVFVFV